MNLFGMMDNSGQAMQAERMRAEVVAANMANAETTRTAAGTAYKRRQVIFAAGAAESFSGEMTSAIRNTSLPLPGESTLLSGVRIAGVVEDPAPPLKRYDPGHPDADKDGYVSYPDINPLTEMVDLMGATRAYGFNSSAVQAEKAMVTSSLEIAR